MRKLKVMTVVGTRPEIVKLEPLSPRLLSVDVHWPYLLKDGGQRPGETSRYVLHLGEGGALKIRSAVVLGPR